MNRNSKPLIVDGHLDLAMNAMEWNRDLRWSIAEIPAVKKGSMTSLIVATGR